MPHKPNRRNWSCDNSRRSRNASSNGFHNKYFEQTVSGVIKYADGYQLIKNKLRQSMCPNLAPNVNLNQLSFECLSKRVIYLRNN